MDSSVVVLLSGFITAGAGLVIDSSREKARIDQIRGLLKSGVCSDLANAVHLYNKFIQSWQKTGQLCLSTLHALENSSPTYRSNPEWLGLFDEYVCSEALYSYHADSARLLMTIVRQHGELIALEGTHQLNGMRYEEIEEALKHSMETLVECRNQAVELLNILYFDGVTKAA